MEQSKIVIVIKGGIVCSVYSDTGDDTIVKVINFDEEDTIEVEDKLEDTLKKQTLGLMIIY